MGKHPIRVREIIVTKGSLKSVNLSKGGRLWSSCWIKFSIFQKGNPTGLVHKRSTGDTLKQREGAHQKGRPKPYVTRTAQRNTERVQNQRVLRCLKKITEE